VFVVGVGFIPLLQESLLVPAISEHFFSAQFEVAAAVAEFQQYLVPLDPLNLAHVA
jgi:hypothetical protein